MSARPLLCSLLLLTALASTHAGTGPAPGDLVRLTRGETLLLDGKNFAGAPKGEDFTLLQLDPAQKTAFVEYYKKDGSRIALALPAEALEPSPADGWSDLLHGVEAFRDGRDAVSRTYLARAGQDAQQKALAGAIAARLGLAAGARVNRNPVAGAQAMQSVRDLAAALGKNGNYTLGLAIDLGADRLGALFPSAAPSKLDPADKQRGETATRAAALCRQAYAVHKTEQAAALAKEAATAEPTRPDVLALQKKIEKDLAEAADRLADADRMRKIPNGAVHALTALQLGLKLAADHPGLVALKNEMQGALEERTAPPLTPALLKNARTSPAALEEGRKLYTTRCVECHDLEMVDSRSASGWEKMVGNMSRRAHIDSEQQARIVEYLTVALNAVQ